MPSRPDLCLVFDAVVASEPASPKLTGKLCVGVTDRSEQKWWSVDLADVTTAHFGAEVDEGATCVWVLGEDEARTVLSGTGLTPADNHRVYGDVKVLEAFRRHYLTTRSPIAVRAGGAA